MKLNPTHPLTLAFSAIAPIVGANFVLSSGRDSESPQDVFPLIEYFVIKERKAIFDYNLKAWRVELVVQLNYLIEESKASDCLESNELSDSQAVQALQFGLTGRIRAIIQLICHPSTFHSALRKDDFIWGKYDIKCKEIAESYYFRNTGADQLTGTSSVFAISLIDVSNVCCINIATDEMLSSITPTTKSYKTIKGLIDD